MKNELMNVNINDTKTMTSREIAVLTGKEHKHVIRDIEKLVEDIGPNLDQSLSGIKTSTYADAYNRQQKQYELNYRMTMTLITGYTAKLRDAVIGRWIELEQAQQPQLPTDYVSALEHLLEAKKAEQALIQQNTELEEELDVAASSHRAIVQSEQIRQGELPWRVFCKMYTNLREKEVKARLHEIGILMDHKTNMPYVQYVNEGWFVQRGDRNNNPITVLTPKGVAICKTLINMEVPDISLAKKLYKRGEEYLRQGESSLESYFA